MYDYLAFAPAESLVWGFAPIMEVTGIAVSIMHTTSYSLNVTRLIIHFQSPNIKSYLPFFQPPI